MGKIVLVKVDPATSRKLAERQSRGQMSFEEVGEATEALARVKQGELKPDAMVLGPQVGEPMRIALSLQSLAKDLAVLILSEPDAYERMNEAVRLSPFFSNQVICCSTADGEGVIAAMEEGVARTRQRREAVAARRERTDGNAASLQTVEAPAAAPDSAAGTAVAEPPEAPEAAEAESWPPPAEPEELAQPPEEPVWLAPIGIATVDDQVQIRTIDSAARELLGLDTEEFPEGSLSRLFPEHERERLVIFVTRSLIAEKRISPDIFDLPTTDGRPRKVELTVSRLENSGAPGAIVLFEDLTPRLHAEKEVAKSAEALRNVERKYQDLVDASRDLVWSLDLQGRLTSVNQAASRILGYSPREMKGRLLTEFLPADGAGSALEMIERVRSGEPRFRCEIEARRQNGTPAHLEMRVVVVRDGEGKVLGAMGTAADISEAHREREAIREGEERLRTVLTGLPALVTAFDEQRNPVVWNEECEMATGYAADEIVGKSGTWEMLIPDKAYRRSMLDEWKRRGSNYRDWEWDYTRKDGSVRTIAWSSIATRHPVPAWSSWAVGRDVTDERRIDRAVRLAQAAVAAVESSENAEEALRVGLERICEMGGWALGQAWRPGGDGELLECSLAWHEGVPELRVFREVSKGMKVSPGRGMAGRAWSNRKPQWLDTADDEETFANGRDARGAGILAGAAFPLLAGTERVGVLEFFSRTPSPRNETTLRLVSMVTSLIASVLFQARSAEERRVLEQGKHQLESWIQRAQRLENLGVLAGGVAHEFNGQLTNLLGNASMALMHLGPRSQARRNIQQIETTARRAAELISQMLAYSGKGKFDPQALDLSVLVRDMTGLFLPVVGDRATVRNESSGRLPAIEADATQIRQVVMNLVTNASESFGSDKGTIRIRTGVMNADRGYLSSSVAHDNLPEGQYVYLEVADDGQGMDAETASRMFDPFFTMKFSGRGIGLAAALGIVRGHRGTIKVDSEVGKGTTIRVLFPGTDRPVETAAVRSRGSEDWKGSGTVLVIEEGKKDRSSARKILKKFGFNVLTASDGAQGIETYRKNSNEIVAVVVDLSLPRMDGVRVFDEIRKQSPGARVFLTHSVAEQDAPGRLHEKGFAGFLEKPFPPTDLIDKLREVLG